VFQIMEMSIAKDLWLSLLRWGIGLSIGSFAGLLVATIGQVRLLRRGPYVFLLDFLRAIPIIGLVPVIQMNIGVNEYGKVGLIAWGVMFPVWLTVRGAFSKTLPDAELMLRGINIDRLQFYKVYIWPKILGGFIHGIEIGVGIAWLCVVAAEWIGTYTQGFWAGGIGYRLVVGYNQNDWVMVHLVLLLFGVLGTTTALLWRVSVRFIFRRCDGFDPMKLQIIG